MKLSENKQDTTIFFIFPEIFQAKIPGFPEIFQAKIPGFPEIFHGLSQNLSIHCHAFGHAHTIFDKADTNERLIETLYPYAEKPIAHGR